ncbi:MAG TPA: DUF4173 domain-containing protein [Planctomycetaceae bacterium]|nr:DUF4173 domain-containing protein [Planctomycetaceae bacterium]
MSENPSEHRPESSGALPGDAPPLRPEADRSEEPLMASIVPEAVPVERPPFGGVSGGYCPPPLPRDDRDLPPPGWRELIAVVALVVLSDLTVYRGNGFAGYALLFLVAPALFVFGSHRPHFGWAFRIVGFMLLTLSAKLLWHGSWLLVGIGFALLLATALALSGRSPYVLAVLEFATRTVWSGLERVEVYGRKYLGPGAAKTGGQWLNVAMPVVAFLVFGMIFVVANPDVLGYVSENLEIVFTHLHEWLATFSMGEVVFWAVVFWVSLGLLRPSIGRLVTPDHEPFEDTIPAGAAEPAPFYAAYRNTLATVIVLFAVYLIFEFNTLWFHVFPPGFYYSGYAHEGAAWLTFALALATAMLSFIFGGQTIRDPRVAQLRRLAWIWSAQNFILAVAVYNRLGIYIGFNGMTRMRIVGIFGMTAVVVGFILVLRKIARNRSFAWLLRGHLLTVAVAVYLFALTPLDAIVCRYNTRRILAGDLKPSVQITEHPISAEGILALRPLLKCDDPIIREGVRALLAQRDQEAEALVKEQTRLGWTAYQMADHRALREFRAGRADWNTFASEADRQAAYDAFRSYAYQWY